MEELLRICDGDQNSADKWAERVRTMQGDILNLICSQSERTQLSAKRSALQLCSFCAQAHLTPAHSSLLQPKFAFPLTLG